MLDLPDMPDKLNAPIVKSVVKCAIFNNIILANSAHTFCHVQIKVCSKNVDQIFKNDIKTNGVCCNMMPSQGAMLVFHLIKTSYLKVL